VNYELTTYIAANDLKH